MNKEMEDAPRIKELSMAIITHTLGLQYTSIKTKLIAVIVFLTLITIIVGGDGIWGIKNVQDNLNMVITQQNAKIRLIYAMRLDYSNAGTGNWGAVAAVDPATVQYYIQQWKQSVVEFRDDYNAYLALPHTSGEQGLLPELKTATTTVFSIFQPILDLYQTNPGAVLGVFKSIAASFNINNQGSNNPAVVIPALNHLLTYLNQYTEQVRNDADNTFHILLVSMGGILVFGVLISFLIVVFITSKISATLQGAAHQLHRSSFQLSKIAEQQSSGSEQQVWAINAINKGLNALQDNINSVTYHTDQVASVGNQMLERYQTLTREHYESIARYLIQQMNEMSAMNHHQKTTIESMTSAMQAANEIADQVLRNSKQTTENAHDLDYVVDNLRSLVTGKLASGNKSPNRQ
jgi:methyl-accepting chemotaxis protein